MRRAAGIAFVTPWRSHVLLAKRADWVSTYPKTWAAPGGGVEPREGRFDAALREVEEELGLDAEEVEARACFFAVVQIRGDVAFTMYVAEIDPSWVARNIRLNNENTAAGWFPLSRKPPERLHPGMRAAWKILLEEAAKKRSSCSEFPSDHARIAP